MKKYYLLFLTGFLLCVFSKAQNPSGWCSEPDPPVERQEYTIYGIDSGSVGHAPVIDGEIDPIWEQVTADTLKQYALDDDDDMTATVKWMYDDVNLYLLVIVENDDVLASGKAGDHFELMYQKDFGGSDTGTVAGHDGDADWRNWYWIRDGDRKTTFPTALEIYEYHKSGTTADIQCYNWETSGEDEYSLQEEILLNESLFIHVDIDTNDDDTYNYTYEVSLTWDKWLNWDAPPTTDDTLGLDVSVRDADEDPTEKVGHINLNDPDNQSWCASVVTAMVHIGPKKYGTVGMQNNLMTPGIEVFPNPASEFITIKTDKTIEEVRIQNILGQQVSLYSYPDDNTINVNDLEGGIYILSVKIDGIVGTKKIVIK